MAAAVTVVAGGRCVRSPFDSFRVYRTKSKNCKIWYGVMFYENGEKLCGVDRSESRRIFTGAILSNLPALAAATVIFDGCFSASSVAQQPGQKTFASAEAATQRTGRGDAE
jgi:hypothetical protein